MKHIKEIVFSMVVVMLLTVIGFQYDFSRKQDANYAALHESAEGVLHNSQEDGMRIDYLSATLTECANNNDTLKLALGNTNEMLKKMTEHYKKKEQEVIVFDKAHDSLWEQYLALQADYNAYMDYINSGEDKQKLLAGIEACVADQKSIRNSYDKLAITYNQLYEYSDSIYAYSNAVYRDYHRLDSAYNILFDEYEVLYNEYLNDGAEVVSNE
jgi:hypothetical protein